MSSNPHWLDRLPAECDRLRRYQLSLVEQLAVSMQQVRRVLLQAPTGSGKTHVIAAITAAATLAGLRPLVLATRTRLVRQLHERLDDFGIHHGIIAAALRGGSDSFALCQVASVDTLVRRCLNDARAPLPSADLVIFDEAHLATGATRVELIGRYPNAALIGLTATPATTNGRPLGALFDRLILGPTVRELVHGGDLVPCRIFNAPAVSKAELAGVSISSATGDYAAGELGAVMSRPKIVGDVVQNWLRLAAGLRTIVFACDKAHGAHLLAQFLRAGVPAELVTDQDDDAFREAAIARLESGETLVLLNCFLLSYGIDVPAVECIQLARPTRSVVLYLQAVGRGMRPSEGKRELLVLDHGRVVETLGMPTDDFRWSLEGSENVNRAARERQRRAVTREATRTCPECGHLWLVSEHGHACLSCGWRPEPVARPVHVDDADLVPLDPGAHQAATDEELVAFFSEACGWYRARWPERWNAKPAGGRWWAWAQTRRRFELAPEAPIPYPFWRIDCREPSAATAGWLKSQLIRWARSRAGSHAARV